MALQIRYFLSFKGSWEDRVFVILSILRKVVIEQAGRRVSSLESGSSISATTFSKTVTSVEPRIMEMKITLNKMMVKYWFPLKDIHVVIVTYNV